MHTFLLLSLHWLQPAYLLGAHLSLLGVHLSLLGVHLSLLVAHLSLLVAHLSLLGVHLSLLGVHLSLLGANLSLLVAHLSLLVAHLPLLGANLSLLGVHLSLLVVHMRYRVSFNMRHLVYCQFVITTYINCTIPYSYRHNGCSPLRKLYKDNNSLFPQPCNSSLTWTFNMYSTLQFIVEYDNFRVPLVSY